MILVHSDPHALGVDHLVLGVGHEVLPNVVLRDEFCGLKIVQVVLLFRFCRFYHHHGLLIWIMAPLVVHVHSPLGNGP